MGPVAVELWLGIGWGLWLGVLLWLGVERRLAVVLQLHSGAKARSEGGAKARGMARVVCVPDISLGKEHLVTVARFSRASGSTCHHNATLQLF